MQHIPVDKYLLKCKIFSRNLQRTLNTNHKNHTKITWQITTKIYQYNLRTGWPPTGLMIPDAV